MRTMQTPRRRQLILPPALPIAPTIDTPDPESPPDTDIPLPDPFIPEIPDPHNEIGSTYDEVGSILYWYNIQHKDGDIVALYHTSTHILTYGLYVTMLTDPRSFYGYAHVYGSVSCTSTRNMNTF